MVRYKHSDYGQTRLSAIRRAKQTLTGTTIEFKSRRRAFCFVCRPARQMMSWLPMEALRSLG